MKGVNFTQNDTWMFENVRLIREQPSDDKTNEDAYYGLEFLGRDKTIWLDKKARDKIDEVLLGMYVDFAGIKEDTIYNFDCTCAEGVESYIRHGQGRCDGCHGRIFK